MTGPKDVPQPQPEGEHTVPPVPGAAENAAAQGRDATGVIKPLPDISFFLTNRFRQAGELPYRTPPISKFGGHYEKKIPSKVTPQEGVSPHSGQDFEFIQDEPLGRIDKYPRAGAEFRYRDLAGLRDPITRRVERRIELTDDAGATPSSDTRRIGGGRDVTDLTQGMGEDLTIRGALADSDADITNVPEVTMVDLAKDAADRLIRRGSILDPLDPDVSQGLPLLGEPRRRNKLYLEKKINIINPYPKENPDQPRRDQSQDGGPQNPPVKP